jgi:hypothetical protein
LVLLEDGKDAPIAALPIDLRPMLHDAKKIEGTVVLTLADEYVAMWNAEAAEDGENPPPIDDTDTVLVWSVESETLLGPPEDRAEKNGDWTSLTISVNPISSIPEQCLLGTAGGPNPADPENHVFTYGATVLGVGLPGAELKAGEEPVAEATDGEEAPAPKPFIAWNDPERIEYRGNTFLKKFREMLERTGGVWLSIKPEKKEGDAPAAKGKGAAGPPPEEVDEAAAALTAQRLFVDLMGFMAPGCTEVTVTVPLDPTPPPEDPEEAEAFRKAHPWAAAKSEVQLRIAIRKSIVLPLDEQVPGLEIP